MNNTNRTLLKRMGTIVALGIAASIAMPVCAASKNDQSNNKGKKAVPVIVVAPVGFITVKNFANGCWLRLYDDENYKGQFVTVAGPLNSPDMVFGPKERWEGEADSAIVGPKATVTIYAGHNYGSKKGVLKRRQHVANLGKYEGLFQDIDSLKIRCAK